MQGLIQRHQVSMLETFLWSRLFFIFTELDTKYFLYFYFCMLRVGDGIFGNKTINLLLKPDNIFTLENAFAYSEMPLN